MSTTWGDAYFDHMTRFLGDPVDRKVFAQSHETPPIQILAFDRVFQGCATFCSLGLTHYDDRIAAIAEILSAVDVHAPRPLPAYFDLLPYVLANSLFYIIQNRMSFGRGVSIDGIDKINSQFVIETGKTAVYFTTPFGLPEEFRLVSHGNRTGRFHLAMFISKAEHEFFLDRGADEFENRLALSDLDAYDLERSSCV